MKNPIFQKTVFSPFLFVDFAAIVVTSLLLFFHVHGAVIMTVHKWAGITFVVLGLLHMILNFRTFLSYFRLYRAYIAVLVGVGMVAGLMAWGANRQGVNHRSPQGQNPPTER
jgi:hypothetical protein